MITDLENFGAGGNKDKPAFSFAFSPFFNEFILPFKIIVAPFSEDVQTGLLSLLCRWLIPNVAALAVDKGWEPIDIYSKKHSVELECIHEGKTIIAFLRAEGFQIAELKINDKG
jgi:hypothetical protein